MKRMDSTMTVTLFSQALFVAILLQILSGALSVERETVLFFSGVAMFLAMGALLFTPAILSHPKAAYWVAWE